LYARLDPLWRASLGLGQATKVLIVCAVLSGVSYASFHLHWLIAGLVASAIFTVALSNPAKKETPWTESNPKGTFTDKTKRAALALTFAPVIGAFAGLTYPDSWHGAAIAALVPSCLVIGCIAFYLQASASYSSGGATRYKFN